MQSPSGLGAGPALLASSPSNQRTHYRQHIHSLVYVTLDQGNGGIIRNLSQSGAAIQAVGALHQSQVIRMRFDLLQPKTRIDVTAEVAWATPGGQAGLRFVDMSPQTRRQLSLWIFSGLLRNIEQALPAPPQLDEQEDLVLSPDARPAIRLFRTIAAPAAAESAEENTLSLAWWPSPISVRALAGLMDGLLLFSAVLTFFCVFLGVAKTLPAWPVALGLIFGVAGFLTALYWFVFVVLGRGTPGVVVARLAMTGSDADEGLPTSDVRFR